MKINPINFYNFKTYKQNFKQNQNIQKPNYQMPDYRFYQSFLGGYSLNLAQTYNNLNIEQYPNTDIPAMIQSELEFGRGDKTLYDIHFEKYKKLLDCYSLEDLKQGEFAREFPELKGVIPSSEIQTPKKGSFIDNYRLGQYEIFNKDEDLTLQIIKLYWGQGFSLSDLADYIAKNSPDNKPVNLRYTMNKLNIPLMNPRYAEVLKLSNKDYNDKFTSEMSLRLRQAKEAAQQYAEGEAVVIPRGELSPSHKKHISEGLKKHFREHPEKLLEMSKRQKKFYEENDLYREEISTVMDYAWNKTQEGKSVAKHLSKFLKKFYSVDIARLNLAKDMSTISKKAMDDFWAKNSWAKEQFSKAAKKGWEYLKTHPVIDIKNPEKQNCVVLHYIPKTLQKELADWAIAHGYRVPDVALGSVYLYQDKKNSISPRQRRESEQAQRILDATRKEFSKKADMCETAKLVTLISIENDFKIHKHNLPQSVRNSESSYQILYEYIKSELSKEHFYTKGYLNGTKMKIPQANISGDKIDEVLTGFATAACTMGHTDMVDYINNRLDEVYIEVAKDKENKGSFDRFLAY